MGHPVLFNFISEEHRAAFLRPEDVDLSGPPSRLHAEPLEIFLFGTWEVESFLERFASQGPGYEAMVFPHDRVREINVCAPGADKVEGVAAVARRMGVSPDEVLAIGDGDNDIRLMRWAGYAVAMGSGHRNAQAVAQFVTNPEDPDPVLSAVDWALSSSPPQSRPTPSPS
jgi:hypothetical protein